jgi:hypothetical protein
MKTECSLLVELYLLTAATVQKCLTLIFFAREESPEDGEGCEWWEERARAMFNTEILAKMRRSYPTERLISHHIQRYNNQRAYQSIAEIRGFKPTLWIQEPSVLSFVKIFGQCLPQNRDFNYHLNLYSIDRRRISASLAWVQIPYTPHL